jgi:hypothetical protein
MSQLKREVRTFSGAQLRAKQAAGDKPGAEGYAAVFNQVADLGWFKETIKPGAFTRAIAEKQDVRCLFNHDEDKVLGRTKNDTLTLSEDKTGLYFIDDFPETQCAADLRALLDRKDVDQCSFGFVVRKQTWTDTILDDGTLEEVRQIEDVDLLDVSIVTYPAYEGTSCEARSSEPARIAALWPDGMPTEVEQRKTKKKKVEEKDSDCKCSCAECQDGNCSDCSNTDCDDPNCEGSRCAHAPAAKETKSVDGESLTAECFLIVGDAKDSSTWKLPYKFSTDERTASHLKNALSRFNQLKGVDDEAKQKAWRKLTKLCKKFDIDVNEKNSRRWGITAAQLVDLRDATADDENDELAESLEYLMSIAHQVKIDCGEILQPIAGAVEDPKAAIQSIADELKEITAKAAKGLAECTEALGDSAASDTRSDTTGETAAAYEAMQLRLRAIQASL